MVLWCNNPTKVVFRKRVREALPSCMYHPNQCGKASNLKTPLVWALGTSGNVRARNWHVTNYKMEGPERVYNFDLCFNCEMHMLRSMEYVEFRNVNKMSTHVFTTQLKKLSNTSTLKPPCVDFAFTFVIVNSSQNRFFFFNLKNDFFMPWLVWLSGVSAGLQTKGSQVRFLVRAHARVVAQVPSGGVCERQPHIDVSLPLLLSPFPSL